MLILIERIAKNVAKVFLPIYGVELLFKLLFLFLGQENYLLMIHGIWVMLASTMLVVYSLNDLFKLIYTREYFFFYTIKYKIPMTLFIYTVIYIMANFIFYLLYSTLTFKELSLKLLSLISFYILNIALLMLTRSFFSIKLGRLVYLLLLTVLTVGTSLLYMLLFHKGMAEFMIGASNYEHAEQIYNLIIPVTVVKKEIGFGGLEMVPIIINTAFSLFGISLFLSLKNSKINW